MTITQNMPQKLTKVVFKVLALRNDGVAHRRHMNWYKMQSKFSAYLAHKLGNDTVE